MPPDPHSDSPDDDARRGPRPDRDPHRADRVGDRNPPGGSGQFAAGWSLDGAAPGPGLAAALGCARTGLGILSDDALAGFLGGCQKIAAWSAGMLLEGIAEYAARRPDDRTPGHAARHAAAAKTAQAALAAGEPADPPGYDEFAPDELMPVLRLSKGGASRQVELALSLRYRLRPTLAAMLDGQIDVVRARIIAEATADLTAADAAAVEALVLARAGQQTYVALGMAVGRAVLQVDPQGTIRRRKRAEKRARVERWRECDGTGALAGRNLPPDDTLAADQALTARALELRAAGLDGPLDYLRATALIDQITGRDSRPRPGRDPIATTCCDHHDAELGYTPSQRLRHKIHARTPTCSYWGCRRPAAQCDDDHTTAWERGGLTCQCNLTPLCRRHHRMKQREGWALTQHEPGVLVWRAPSGRTHTTTPAVYLS
jgi:hypothetical protein